MKKIALLLLGLLLAQPALAADNAVIVTPGVGVTMKSKDIGAGVQAMQPILSDSAGAALLTTLGADAVSNTLTGIPVYSRGLVFNGTTWDRWTGAVTVSGVATATLQGTINTSIGTTNTTLTSTNTKLDSIITNTGAAIPAGTAIIGKVGVDQTTPGTTNGVAIVGVNAATALAGNGATGTGSQRVTIASDNSPVSGFGVGATGAAPPANATYMGALSGTTAGGLTTGLIACDSSVVYDASTSGSTELVALSGTKVIYVCGYSIVAGGTVNVKLITGTGTACATGSSNKTPAYQLTAQAGIADGAPFFRGIKTAAGGALCINASGAVAAQAIVYYAQF